MGNSQSFTEFKVYHLSSNHRHTAGSSGIVLAVAAVIATITESVVLTATVAAGITIVELKSIITPWKKKDVVITCCIMLHFKRNCRNHHLQRHRGYRSLLAHFN